IILGQRQQLDRMTDLLRETQHFAKAILNTANELASKVNYYESVVPRKDQRIAELEAESHDLKLALNYEQDKVAVLTREIAKLKAAAKKK
ncbi:MAG: hypothetical protein EBQ92_00865, partial [Proteobacteria bacterium]|nr:hypothetical protein [Pseudomonadota bacterium]